MLLVTAAERRLIRAEVDRRQRARHRQQAGADVPAELYLRILAACCLNSPIDVEEHARRIALTITQTQHERQAA